MIALLTPITRPLEPSSGPPELPGLTAASVWASLFHVPAPAFRDPPQFLNLVFESQFSPGSGCRPRNRHRQRRRSPASVGGEPGIVRKMTTPSTCGRVATASSSIPMCGRTSDRRASPWALRCDSEAPACGLLAILIIKLRSATIEEMPALIDEANEAARLVLGMLCGVSSGRLALDGRSGDVAQRFNPIGRNARSRGDNPIFDWRNSRARARLRGGIDGGRSATARRPRNR
jgi:hypothetical protein